MRANGDVIGSEAPGVSLDWERTRCWAERALSKDRLAQAGIAVAGLAAFLALVLLVEYSLFQAVENWSISEVGASVFGYF